MSFLWCGRSKGFESYLDGQSFILQAEQQGVVMVGAK
jgi:hypothetical protein